MRKWKNGKSQSCSYKIGIFGVISDQCVFKASIVNVGCSNERPCLKKPRRVNTQVRLSPCRIKSLLLACPSLPSRKVNRRLVPETQVRLSPSLHLSPAPRVFLSRHERSAAAASRQGQKARTEERKATIAGKWYVCLPAE